MKVQAFLQHAHAVFGGSHAGDLRVSFGMETRPVVVVHLDDPPGEGAGRAAAPFRIVLGGGIGATRSRAA